MEPAGGDRGASGPVAEPDCARGVPSPQVRPASSEPRLPGAAAALPAHRVRADPDREVRAGPAATRGALGRGPVHDPLQQDPAPGRAYERHDLPGQLRGHGPAADAGERRGRAGRGLRGSGSCGGSHTLPSLAQQLNAIIAASMSLKSSSKLRHILEVRASGGAGPDGSTQGAGRVSVGAVPSWPCVPKPWCPCRSSWPSGTT